ncbi:MAG: hypothetical protein OHK0022_03670 [Roseiflexaceae bacterium]
MPILILTCAGLAAALVALATVAGVAWQGSALRSCWLLALAGLSQAALIYGYPLPGGPLAGLILALAWALRNRALPGSGWLIAGLLANGLAMAANGGTMPLAPHVAEALGVAGQAHGLLAGSKDSVGTAGPLVWLADWIVLRTPWATWVASPGDFAILAALVRWGLAQRLEARGLRLGRGSAEARGLRLEA